MPSLPPPRHISTLPEAVADALVELRARRPDIRRAVVKLNEGFLGEGNAIFKFDGAPEGSELRAWVQDQLPHLVFEAKDMTWDLFAEKLAGMGGIVEEFLEAKVKRSPSVQFRVDPLGELEPVSTHDQVLGGDSGQVFLGARFPATIATGSRSRRGGSRPHVCWPRRACSDALPSTSCR